MGFSILLDLAILVGFGAGAIMAHPRSVRLGCGLMLFGLVGVDLVSQIAASAMERMILEAAYPMLYSVMLMKNFLFLALAVYSIVRAVDFPQAAAIHHPTSDLAHPV